MPTTTRLSLARRDPFDGAALLRVIDARAATGLERVADGGYTRTMRLPGGAGAVRLQVASPDRIQGELRTADAADAPEAEARVRHLLDLDSDPAVVDAHLGEDPALAAAVAARPGLRVLGTVDGFELALRAVIGQQVSVAAARTVLGRIVAACGPPLPDGLDPGTGELLRLLPDPAVVAELPDEALAMPRSRAATVRRLASAVAAGDLDLRLGVDPEAAVEALLALKGIGPWTASYVAMRGLGDRDAFPAADLGLKQGAEALGLPSDPKGLSAYSARWSPWRAYAAQHLWAVAAESRATLSARPRPR